MLGPGADLLRSQGRHLRLGLLLHGPPGTGKTLTATYLAEALEDRIVLVLTGAALGLIRATCVMARQLQPATVVLEDIDLIAEERTGMGPARRRCCLSCSTRSMVWASGATSSS